MGAQGNAPMCRGLGCVPGSMSRRRRAQLASYPGISRGGKTCPDGSSYPADVPCPPAEPPGGSGGSAVNPVFWLGSANPDWCKENPGLCSNGRPDPRKIAMAVNGRGGPMGESIASQRNRMQRRLRAEVTGHHRSVPNSPYGKIWSRGNTPGESYIVTDGDYADVEVTGYERG